MTGNWLIPLFTQHLVTWVPLSLPGLQVPSQQGLALHLHILSALFSTQPRPGVNEGLKKYWGMSEGTSKTSNSKIHSR